MRISDWSSDVCSSDLRWTRRSAGCISTARRPRGLCRGRRRTQGALRNDKNSGLRGDEPDDHAIGRSRGGLTTKTHALVDGKGRLLTCIVSPGQAGDSPVLPALLGELKVHRHRSEEHTSELQSLMRISYADF